MENAFGCQSACAQTALPLGPAFGAACAYEKCILDGGPSYITSSTAQGGGGSFKNRKPIGEIGCCESGMAERSH